MSEISPPKNSVEANRQNFNTDWRAIKPVFDEQMSYFCMKEEMADVEFTFNRQNKITKIPAHTFALVVASEVFQKELTYGENMTEKRAKTLQVVEVNDEMVEIEAFKTTLLFIYNTYKTKNVELTGDSALAVLYIAMKYLIRPLEAYCVNYLLNKLSAENVFTILQFCIDIDTNSRLMDESKEFLRNQTEAVVKVESFLKISHKCLILLLEQDCLNITEVRLFEAVVDWAKSACKNDGKDPNVGKNLRKMLGAALQLIRFPTMSMKEFRELVDPTGILTLKQQRDVIYMIGGADPVGRPISTTIKPRKLNKYSASIDVLSQTTLTKHELLIRIENFPTFVASKAQYSSREICINNALWNVGINLKKHCHASNRYYTITPGSPYQPEYLGAFLFGKRSIQKDCSFEVTAKFRFNKQPPTGKKLEQVFTRKFCFNAANKYSVFVNYSSSLAKINDLLAQQKGYLVDNTLELFVDVTIAECAGE